MDQKVKISSGEIQLNVQVDNWKEAIQAAAAPLIDENKISEDYVTSMIASLKKFGPYIVIAPGLALGHAKPSSAVKKTSFSIATLRKPVKFGNKDNDPVDVVIILASINNKDHLELLQKLVQFLNNQNNLKKLRTANSGLEANKIAQSINGE